MSTQRALLLHFCLRVKPYRRGDRPERLNDECDVVVEIGT